MSVFTQSGHSSQQKISKLAVCFRPQAAVRQFRVRATVSQKLSRPNPVLIPHRLRLEIRTTPADHPKD